MADQNKVVTLRPGRAIAEPRGPSEDCIAHLEVLLEQARAGKLRGIAVAGVLQDCEMQTSWAGDVGVGPTASAIALLQHRFMVSWNRSPD